MKTIRQKANQQQAHPPTRKKKRRALLLDPKKKRPQEVSLKKRATRNPAGSRAPNLPLPKMPLTVILRRQAKLFMTRMTKERLSLSLLIRNSQTEKRRKRRVHWGKAHPNQLARKPQLSLHRKKHKKKNQTQKLKHQKNQRPLTQNQKLLINQVKQILKLKHLKNRKLQKNQKHLKNQK